MDQEKRLKMKAELQDKLIAIVVSSGLTYHDALSVLGHVANRFREKGDNLLNGLSIQEVAEAKDRFGR